MSEGPVLTAALFHHYPWDDTHKVRDRIADPELGPHWYFRCVKSATRARFHQLVDHQDLPRVMLFGSPHIDNYAKTDTGCGMIDFDRSYYGPYAWDVVCLLLSVSLRQTSLRFHLCSDAILTEFLEGYLHGLRLGEAPFDVYQPLAETPPKKWQQSIVAYRAKNKKWAKKMQEYPVAVDDPLMNELMFQYLHNAEADLSADHYRLQQAGRCQGTFGRIHNILLLEHINGGEPLLLDIKHTRTYVNSNWPHDRFYHSDFEHDGQRMITASKILAPGVTAGESYATVNGVQYWGRHVPLQNAKIKGNLSEDQQLDFCYAVATQLGRGHGLTQDAKVLAAHIHQHYPQFSQACQQILKEIESGWLQYLSMLPVESEV